jgi:hypothetical protein
MAINQVQLPTLQQQIPDLVGSFLRGRQFKLESERNNRLLQLQERQVNAQITDQEARRQKLAEQAETNFFGRASELLAGTSAAEQPMVFEQIRQMATANNLDVSDFPQQFSPELVPFMQNEAKLRGFKPTAKAKPIALGNKERLIDPTTNKVLIGPEKVGQQAPSALVSGLPELIKSQAVEAFNLAGGGKDGVKALNEAVKIGKESLQRDDAPKILDDTFPNATPAERAEIDAAMSAAKTVDSGLKRAGKIREEQRRLKKAKGFQTRAVDLLTGIINNPQLGGVLGPIDGSIDTRLFADAEAELIADIEEAQNILTAENMKLMTGVLSESDIQILKNLASGALNRKRTPARFNKDATQLLEKLQSEPVVTADDKQASTTTADISTRKARLAELKARAGL